MPAAGAASTSSTPSAAREVTSQLRLAHAWGYVADVSAPLALLDRVRAMLWRLGGAHAAA